jgi:hypothetical protein
MAMCEVKLIRQSTENPAMKKFEHVAGKPTCQSLKASTTRNVRDFFDCFLCGEQKVALKKLSEWECGYFPVGRESRRKEMGLC